MIIQTKRDTSYIIIQTVQTSIFHPRLIDSIDVVKRRKAGLYGICFCPLQWWPGSLGWCGCRRRRTWDAAGYTRGGAAGDAASLRGTAAGTSTLWGSFMRNHGNHVIGTIQMCIFTGREYLRMMFAWILSRNTLRKESLLFWRLVGYDIVTSHSLAAVERKWRNHLNTKEPKGWCNSGRINVNVKKAENTWRHRPWFSG